MTQSQMNGPGCGSNVGKKPGGYGSQGVPGVTNVPGSRTSPVTWGDTRGRRWLFGGYGYDYSGAAGYLNDLWLYDPDSNEWTWVSGAKSVNSTSVYGTKGETASSNVPGARDQTPTWADNHGHLWLFGFVVVSSTGTTTYVNDLWRYQP